MSLLSILKIKILSFPWRRLGVWVPVPYSFYIEIPKILVKLNKVLPQPCSRVWIRLCHYMITLPHPHLSPS